MSCLKTMGLTTVSYVEVQLTTARLTNLISSFVNVFVETKHHWKRAVLIVSVYPFSQSFTYKGTIGLLTCKAKRQYLLTCFSAFNLFILHKSALILTDIALCHSRSALAGFRSIGNPMTLAQRWPNIGTMSSVFWDSLVHPPRDVTMNILLEDWVCLTLPWSQNTPEGIPESPPRLFPGPPENIQI